MIVITEGGSPLNETPLSLTVTATVLGLAKRPGRTRDSRLVLSLNASINDNTYELNLVTKQNQTIKDTLNYLANAGYLTKNGNTFTIQVPTYGL